MRSTIVLVLFASLPLAGCSYQPAVSTDFADSRRATSTQENQPADEDDQNDGWHDTADSATLSRQPADAASGSRAPGRAVALTPANTEIQFVGTHVGPKPDPQARTGNFERFSGKLSIDPEAKKLQSVAIDIETGSLQTDPPNLKLTNHLKDFDFLDVREYPTATFASTQITNSGHGSEEWQIRGRLTLHGVTREIAIPARIQITDDGLSLHGEFRIDRTDFGMNRLLERVNPEVDLMVRIAYP